MPKDYAPEITMYRALQSIPEDEIPPHARKSMKYFFQTPWTSLSTREDFELFLEGLGNVEAFIGPRNDHYIRSLHSTRLTFELFCKRRKEWRAWAAEFTKLWEKVVAETKKNLPPGAFEAVRPFLDQMAQDLKGKEDQEW
jgi:hypothetical protein